MTNKRYKLQPLIHAATLVEEQLSDKLAPYGIKPRQARVLNALHLLGSASQVELAREFGVAAASMSTMTARLISGGYISRKLNVDEPGRNQLKLTPKGESLIEPINKSWREIDELIEHSIGEKKAHDLAVWSSELRNALGGRVPAANSGYKFYDGKAKVTE